MMTQITNTCPGHISPELWEGMSADARYQAQAKGQRVSELARFLQVAALLPPLAFVVLPPVQSLVNRFAPPAHYVRLNGVADPRKFLSDKPLEEGDRVGDFEITSGFGERLHPVHGEVLPHNGVDLNTPTGTPLYAPAVGTDKVTVKCWEDSAGGGLVAEIASASVPEYRFKALHLSDCTEGKHRAGVKFAETGESGIGTGQHLDIRQLRTHTDTYTAPTLGYVEWILSGSAGADFIDIPALQDAIVGQESGGDAGAVNSDSGALGLGQVMPENLAGEGEGWDYEALGRDISAAEFLADPNLQTEIIQHQLGAIALSQSTDTEGNPRPPEEIAERSAAVWYSGRGDYCDSATPEFFGATEYPSGAEYCDSIGAKYNTLQQRRLEQLDK